MEIRKYQPKDKENLRDICHLTARDKVYKENKELVYTLYCDYYCDQEPENIFVVADENDNAVGYILCALDYDKFFKTFNKIYLPRVKKLSRFHAFIHRAEQFVYRDIKKQYPAHLHIDLLPVCQGRGFGTKLIGMLCEHLKGLGLSGLSLGVGADNEGAIRFYERLGFKQLKAPFGKAIIFGKKL
jgi:ribosomal protein S18 acetylase RimI-like enzyme